jgi:hypothetical protein
MPQEEIEIDKLIKLVEDMHKNAVNWALARPHEANEIIKHLNDAERLISNMSPYGKYAGIAVTETQRIRQQLLNNIRETINRVKGKGEMGNKLVQTYQLLVRQDRIFDMLEDYYNAIIGDVDAVSNFNSNQVKSEKELLTAISKALNVYKNSQISASLQTEEQFYKTFENMWRADNVRKFKQAIDELISIFDHFHPSGVTLINPPPAIVNSINNIDTKTGQLINQGIKTQLKIISDGIQDYINDYTRIQNR